MHKGGQRDREQDDGGRAPRGTSQHARQCGEGMAAWSPAHSWASRSSVRSKSHVTTHSDKDRQQHARKAAAGTQDAEEPEAQEDRELEDGRGQQQGPRRRQRRLHDLGRRSDARNGQEHQTVQTVRAYDDDGRGLRPTFLWNTVRMGVQVTRLPRAVHVGAATQAVNETQSVNNTHTQWRVVQVGTETSTIQLRAVHGGAAVQETRLRTSDQDRSQENRDMAEGGSRGTSSRR